MIIYRGATEILNIAADIIESRSLDDHTHTVSFQFELADYIQLKKGDKVTYNSVDFFLPNDYIVTKNSETDGYKYSLVFYDITERFKDFILKFDGQTDFPMTTTGTNHLKLIADNLAAAGLGSFTYIENPEVKTIKYENKTIFEALDLIAETYKLEWWIEAATLTLGTYETGTAITLEYGKELNDISFSDASEKPITRLYAYGGTKNMPYSKRLTLPAGTPYVDLFPGLPAEQIIEGVKIFDEIYPKQSDTIATVTSAVITPADRDQQETTIYTITGGPDIETADLLPGETLKMTFTSGMLNGREFEIIIQSSGYEIKYNQEADEYFPNPTMAPQAGDSFFFTGIKADTIIPGLTATAQQELLAKATAFLDSIGSEYVYTLKVNPVLADTNSLSLPIGQKIIIKSDYLGEIQTRIRSYEKKGYEQTYTAGDYSQYSRLAEIESRVKLGTTEIPTAKDGLPGKDGVGIASTLIEYASSASGTVKPTTGYTTSVPTVAAGNYLWTRTTWTYTDNTSEQGFSAARMGEDGAAGISITDVDVEFAKNTTPETAPTTGWTTTAPTLLEGEQLWTRTKTTYSAGNQTSSTPANITPKTGAAGNTGTGIASVTEQYIISTSKTTQPAEGDAGWSTTPPAWENGKYIWSRVKIVYKNPTQTIYTGYAVSSEWEAVNDLQIGAKNLLIGSKNYSLSNPLFAGSTATDSGMDENFWILTLGSTYLQINIPSKVAIGEKFTFSFIHTRRSSSAQNFQVSYGAENKTFTSSSNTTKSVFTFTKTADTYLRISRVEGGSGWTLRIDELQLEKGNKATDWSPAPEDVQAAIDAAVVRATYWSVKASAPVIYKDAINAATSGAHTPVTVSGELRSGTTTTPGGFITVTPNGGTEAGTASASPVTIAPANGDGKTSYTVRLYDTAAKTTLLDTQTIPVVFKGASGVNAINASLSNEADVLPASPEGVVSDYTGSGTIIRVFEGATELDYDGIGTANGKFNVTASATGITAGTKSESGLTCVFANASNMTADNATITFTIAGKTSAGASFSLTKVQAFAKSRTGAKGDKGDKGDQGLQGIPGQKGADGVTYYTWVRYADTPTTGMSQYPTGKAYIGFAYNKTTPTESSTYSDYQWSLIKGEQGIPGDKGADGTQYYTWIKYADTPTSGMSDSPTGKAYIGIAVNKTTATESTNYADYTWQLTKGEKGDAGVSVTLVDVEFAKNTSPTTAPTTGWATTAPTLAEGEQLWTRTKTTYSAGNPTYSTPANITPKTGSTGTGIDSVTEEFAISSSKTVQPTTGWSTTQPSWVNGQYIWSRVKVVYKNPAQTIYTGYAVSSEWEAVNDLQIGGVNLIDGTSDEWQSVSRPSSSYYSNVFYPNTELVVGQTYTFSWEAELVSGANNMYINIGAGTTTFERNIVSALNSTTHAFNRRSITFTPTEYQLGAGNRFAFRWYNNQQAVTFRYRKLKLEIGSKVTDWDLSKKDRQSKIDAAKQEALTAAENAQTSANNANIAVGNLNTYVDGSFKDGVIEASEAKAIEKYINIVNTEKSNLEAIYNTLYTNTYLEGTPKTNLLNAKVTYFGAVDTLLNSINTAISDGKTTAAEKQAVDTNYSSYKTALASLQTAIENANKAIQAKLDAISKGYVDNLQIGGRNLLVGSRNYTLSNPLFTGSTGAGGAIESDGFWVITIGTAYLQINIPQKIAVGERFTFSFIHTRRTGSVQDFQVAYGSEIKQFNSNSDVQKFVFTAVKTSDSYLRLSRVLGGSGWTLRVDEFQLEMGDKATGYSEATEDIQARIDAAKLTAEQAQLAADGYMRARYVRDWSKGYSTNPNANHWKEVQVFNKAGVNLAKNKIPTTNGTPHASYPLTNATDEDINTTAINGYGASVGASLDYLRIDLGQVYYDIDYIKIVHGIDGRITYNTKTEISEDGVNWTPVFDSAKSGTYKETAAGNIISLRPHEVLAKTLKSQAITDKFGTTIDGGLIGAVTMLLRELNSTDETAGISGIRGANRNLPAFWTGTYADAIAGTAGIIFRHNSTGKIGVLDVDANGNVKLLDSIDPSIVRLLFSKSAIPSIESIRSGSDSGSVQNASVLRNTTLTSILPETATIANNGVHMSISGSLRISAGLAAGSNYGEAYVGLSLYKNDVFYSIISQYDMILESASLTTETTPFNVSLNVPAGTYSLVLETSFLNASSGSQAGTNTATTMTWVFEASIRRFEWGTNGFMNYRPNGHIHHTEEKGLDIRGATNMPGILLSGSVATGGGFVNSWGAKKHATLNAQKTATGTYTVYHSVGHTGYSVQITPETDQRVYYIPTASKGTSSFIVYFRNLTGTLSDSNFSFSIMGDNYIT